MKEELKTLSGLQSFAEFAAATKICMQIKHSFITSTQVFGISTDALKAF